MLTFPTETVFHESLGFQWIGVELPPLKSVLCGVPIPSSAIELTGFRRAMTTFIKSFVVSWAIKRVLPLLTSFAFRHATVKRKVFGDIQMVDSMLFVSYDILQAERIACFDVVAEKRRRFDSFGSPHSGRGILGLGCMRLTDRWPL